MTKKKLITSIASVSIVSVTVAGIITGYFVNKESTKYSNYYRAPVSAAMGDLIQAYLSAAVTGTKLIYLSSFAHTAPITKALETKKENNPAVYNYLGKTGFMLVDDVYGFPVFDDKGKFDMKADQPIWSTNVSSIQFRSDLGSFITGIAIGEFLNENQDYFLSSPNDKLTWATYGGLPYLSVTSFMGGFQHGIKWFNENVVPKVPNYKVIEHLTIGDGNEQNFSNGFGQNDGDDLIDKFLSQKPSVFIPVAGSQVQSAIRKIYQSSNLRTVVIGVDSPVEEDLTINLPIKNSDKNVGNNKIVQFSSIKNLNVMINKVTNAINNGVKPDNINNNDASNEYIGGIGYSSLGTPGNNGVGVSEAGYQYFVKALQLFNNSSYSDVLINRTQEEWTKLYLEFLGSNQVKDILKEFDKPENKVYTAQDELWNYHGMPNEGATMFPILEADNKESLTKWYKETYPDHSELLLEENVNLLMQWVANNKSTIEYRSQLDLTNQITKEQYDINPNICKIISQSASSILFDNSFYQSCYYGLVAYWKEKGVNLPTPKK